MSAQYLGSSSMEYVHPNKNYRISSKYTNGFTLFFEISTIVDYLMPNPVYSYILDIVEL